MTLYYTVNNAVAALTSSHTISDGVLHVNPISIFGNNFPLRVTCVRQSDNANFICSIGSSGATTLNITGFLEGTSDLNLAIGDTCQADITAGTISDIHGAITSVSGIATSGSVIVGNPVGSSSASGLLFADNSKTLQQSNSLKYDSINRVLFSDSITSVSGNIAQQLSFGGTASGFPSFIRSGTTIKCSLADNSNLTTLSVNTIKSDGGTEDQGGFVVDTGGTFNRVGLMKYSGMQGSLVAGNTTSLILGHRSDSNNITAPGGTISLINQDFIINPNGRIGINKDTAVGQLHIVPGATGVVGMVTQGSDGLTASLHEYQDKNGNRMSIVTKDGCLGIVTGALTPGRVAHFRGSGLDSIIAGQRTDVPFASILLVLDSTNGAWSFQNNNGDLILYSNGTANSFQGSENLRFQKNGQFSLGDSSPSGFLQITNPTASWNTAIFKNASSQIADSVRVLSSNNTVQASINSSGCLFSTGFAQPIITVSGNVTLGGLHSVIKVDASGSTTIVTLPSIFNSPVGRMYTIKKIDSTTNPVIVSGVHFIDGQPTLSILSQYDSVTLITDRTEWSVI